MYLLEQMSAVLSGVVLPVILLIGGFAIGAKLRFFYIIHPLRLCRDIKDAAAAGGVSPFRALSVALAGTLGVGSLSGVATAIAAGGAGAVFWMWVCALLVMSVKYAEVYLAQKYKRTGEDGGFFGGAMYYINDGLKDKLGAAAGVIACIFALLVAVNSVLTGNIVQVSAASEVFCGILPGANPIICGCVLAVLSAVAASGGLRRISDLTVKLIPALSAFFIAVSIYAVIRSREALPGAMRAIFEGAFKPAAAGGGALGFGICRAVRFGVTRGLFSNEAGCGTAPSAHAAANAKSPHHQGCLGIFEVFADTIVICTLTALVILTSGITPSENGMTSALCAFSVSAGPVPAYMIGASVFLFAFATIICQSYYGLGAVGYLTQSVFARRAYIFIFAVSSIAGSVISFGLMWTAADLIIAVMTVTNTAVVLYLWNKQERLRIG